MSSDIIASNLSMAQPSAYDLPVDQKRRAAKNLANAAVRVDGTKDLPAVLAALGVTR